MSLAIGLGPEIGLWAWLIGPAQSLLLHTQSVASVLVDFSTYFQVSIDSSLHSQPVFSKERARELPAVVRAGEPAVRTEGGAAQRAQARCGEMVDCGEIIPAAGRGAKDQRGDANGAGLGVRRTGIWASRRTGVQSMGAMGRRLGKAGLG